MLTALAPTLPALLMSGPAMPPVDGLVIRGGWVLRASDLQRLGAA